MIIFTISSLISYELELSEVLNPETALPLLLSKPADYQIVTFYKGPNHDSEDYRKKSTVSWPFCVGRGKGPTTYMRYETKQEKVSKCQSNAWNQSILSEGLGCGELSFRNVRRDGATESHFRWQGQQ